MSDAPLFDDADEQEAANASTRANLEGDASDEQDVDLPIVGMAPSGMASPASIAGMPGVLPPASTPLREDEEEDDSERRPE